MTRRITAALVALALSACAAPERKPAKPGYEPPPSETRLIAIPPKPSQTPADMRYQAADSMLDREMFYKAAKLYMRFISGADKSDPLVDNAYFNVGLSWFGAGRYRDAAEYFDTVTAQYPLSDVYREALINSAICHYHLNAYDTAENKLNKALRRVSEPGLKAYIYFYKGALAEKKPYFGQATDFYATAERMAADQGLVKQARQRIVRLFHNFLSEKELIDAAEKYKPQWPAKLALEELMRIYRQAGDGQRYNATKTEYDILFAPKREPGESEKPRSGDPEYRPEKIRIGVVLPLSGPSAKTGQEIVQGIQLAFNSFHSLIREKNVQLIIRDSGSSPGGGAAELVEELAKDKDVLMILGPVFSDEFEKAADIASQWQVVTLSPSATAEGVTGLSQFLFRNSITNSLEARQMAEYAVSMLGLTRFAVIYPNDRYGRQMSSFFVESVSALGGEVLAMEHYNSDQTDFGEQIRNLGGKTDDQLRALILNMAEANPELAPEEINEILKERFADSLAVPQILAYGELPLNRRNFLPGQLTDYDAVYIPGLYDKVGLILPELEFYNIRNIVKLAGRGANHPDLVRIAEKYSEGLILMDGFFSGSDAPQVASFVRDYHLYFREEPTILSAQAYDAARMALSAIAHGANSRKSLADYMRSLKFFEGVTGEIEMNADGDAQKSLFTLTVENGQIKEYVYEGPLREPELKEPETEEAAPVPAAQ